MHSGETELCREINSELAELRSAIVASDLPAVERHTTRISQSLTALKNLLSIDDPMLSASSQQELRRNAQHTESLLARARQTVHALLAVYSSFRHGVPETSLELR